MLYFDELDRAVLQHIEFVGSGSYKRRKRVFYLDNISRYASGVGVIDFDDLVYERDITYDDIVTALRLGIKFNNIHQDSSGRLYVGDFNKRHPIYVEFKDYTILHTQKELYIGFKDDYYIHLYIGNRKSYGGDFIQENKPSRFQYVGTPYAIGFPRFFDKGCSNLYIPIISYRVNNIYNSLRFNSIKKYKVYHENVREWLKIKYESMLVKR